MYSLQLGLLFLNLCLGQGILKYVLAYVISVPGPWWCCLVFLYISVFICVFMYLCLHWLSSQQHHASILFCVYRQLGTFLCSLRSIIMMSLSLSRGCVGAYVHLCSNRSLYLITVLLIYIIINVFVGY